MVKIGIISLGCPRNLVDSEIILGSLKKEGFYLSDGIGSGVDVFIINTCSFVKSAREESIDTILEAAGLKKEGKIKYLIVAGCLPQAYGTELLKSLPEVDSIIGTSDIPKIGNIVKSLIGGNKHSAVSALTEYLYNEKSPRFSLTAPHYAYVKISEGCDNLCSYCIISRLRGHFRSRTIDSVVKEVKGISSSGHLKEINLIGQDTTFFGMDIYGKSVLPQLLKKLTMLKNSIKWIRVLYTHPAHHMDEFIFTMRDEPKICKYLDLPIQHINDKILKKMNRHVTKKEIINLIEKIRKNIPGIALRTSIIVGFPGETDKDFSELLKFLKETHFEKLGAFIYSREEGSAASKFKGQVPEGVKSKRFDEVMKAQQSISADINRSFLGQVSKVLIDEKLEDGRYFGRTEFDAPEVDGGVYVSGNNLKVGEFYKVKITDTLEYDLVGEVKS
jgi:ribosomal protein S12 methylthiotransferase